MVVKDNIQIDESAFIAENSVIVGRVKLHKDCSVWFYSVVRGDLEPIEIGEGSNVQDCAIIHTDINLPTIIGKNVTIAHGAIVHGAKIGNNVIIAMNATVLNGAEIGDNCIIGAGAVVMENKKIPPNSLVLGIPAKVKKKLDTKSIDRIIINAKEYVKLSKMYKEGYKLYRK